MFLQTPFVNLGQNFNDLQAISITNLQILSLDSLAVKQLDDFNFFNNIMNPLDVPVFTPFDTFDHQWVFIPPKLGRYSERSSFFLHFDAF